MRPFVGSLRSRLIVPVLIAAGPATILVVLITCAWRAHELADATTAGWQVARRSATTCASASGSV